MRNYRSLSLDDALKAISAGMEAATGFGRKMGFVICNKAGERIASALMDGAHPRVLRQAERKAYTAAVMERNTLSFKADLAERNGNLDEWGDIQLTTLQGGLVAKVDGEAVGSVATGGGELWQDEEVGRVMLRAIGIAAVEDKRVPLDKPASAAPRIVMAANTNEHQGGQKSAGEPRAVMRKVSRLPLPKNLIAAGNAPIGAVRIGNAVYTSGIPGVNARSGELPEDPETQFALAFENLQRVLQGAGANADSVGLINVFIPDRAGRAFINKPWLEMFPGENRPARKTNQAPLPPGVKVQLSAVAIIGETRRTIGVKGLAHKDPLPMGARMGDFVFSSVMTAEDPATGKPVEGDHTVQIPRCFENMKLLIEDAGGSEDNINHSWVFLRDMGTQKVMLDEYLRRFNQDGDRPARKTLPYELPPDAAIQIQFTGMLGGRRKNYEVPGIGHHDPIPMASSIGHLLQSSGVYGIDPATGRNAEGFEQQLEHTMAITRRLMEQVGGRLDQIANLTVMVRDFAHVSYIRERLRTLFPDLDNGPSMHFVNYRMPDDMQVQFHITGIV